MTVCIVCLVIFRADVAATVLPDKNCPCLLEAHLCRRECASCLSCMSEPSRLSTDTAARYLSVEPWTFEDGFFDVASFWNFTHPLSPVPIRLPRARPVLSVVDYLRIAESDMIDTTVRIFRKMCADSEQRHGRDHVFMDSGSNEGTFSLLAAAHGCHAIAIDPQPMCLQHMVNGAAESSLQSRIHAYNAILSSVGAVSVENKSLKLFVPIDQCHGTSEFKTYGHGEISDATQTGRALIKRRRDRNVQRKPVSAVRLDTLIANNVQIGLWQ